MKVVSLTIFMSLPLHFNYDNYDNDSDNRVVERNNINVDYFVVIRAAERSLNVVLYVRARV